jgi:hypothetical protein
MKTENTVFVHSIYNTLYKNVLRGCNNETKYLGQFLTLFCLEQVETAVVSSDW